MKRIVMLFLCFMIALLCGCSSILYNRDVKKSSNFENNGTTEKTKKSESSAKSDEGIKDKEEKTKAEKVNLIEKMSDSEKKDLNVFFSNFSEGFFVNYNYQLVNDDDVIDLAYVHVVVNRNGKSGVFYDEKNTYIPLSVVNEVADKYLGITLSGKPTQRWNFDGTNYYRPSADGDPKYYSYSDEQAKSECEFIYASEAVIRKKVYNGKNTWELVSLVTI